MRVRFNCLREFAQKHPAFSEEAEKLALRCYRYCGHRTETVLGEYFEGSVTKELVMSTMLYWVQNPGAKSEDVEAFLLKDFNQVSP